MEIYLWVSSGIFGAGSVVGVAWFIRQLWRRARSEPRGSGALAEAIVMTFIFAFAAATITVALVHGFTSAADGAT